MSARLLLQACFRVTDKLPSTTAWHPDPSRRFPQRHFDGASWTAWVIDVNGAEIADPQGPPW